MTPDCHTIRKHGLAAACLTHRVKMIEREHGLIVGNYHEEGAATHHELELDNPGDPDWIRKNLNMFLLVIKNCNLSQ